MKSLICFLILNCTYQFGCSQVNDFEIISILLNHGYQVKKDTSKLKSLKFINILKIISDSSAIDGQGEKLYRYDIYDNNYWVFRLEIIQFNDSAAAFYFNNEIDSVLHEIEKELKYPGEYLKVIFLYFYSDNFMHLLTFRFVPGQDSVKDISLSKSRCESIHKFLYNNYDIKCNYCWLCDYEETTSSGNSE